MTNVVLVMFGYLLGAVPSAYIAGRLVKGIDVRTVGDGNAGAANAYREIGPIAGIVVLVADALKGVIAVTVAQAFGSQAVVLLTGVAVVVGHNRPVYIGFRGGRGEATTIGVLSVLLPREMALLVAVCSVPFMVTRNTMVAGAILFGPLWLVAWLMGEQLTLVLYSMALPALVGLTHLMTTRNLSDQARKDAPRMRRTTHSPRSTGET